MSLDTVECALKKIKNKSETLTIGGGEPTLHPYFFDIIKLCKKYGFKGEKIWMCTNGSQKEIMKKLHQMALHEEIQITISRDKFHKKLDPEVEKWFTSNRMYDDFRTFQSATDPMPIGRWQGKKSDRKGECCCLGPFIRPNGKVYQCGCPKAIHVGNVFQGFNPFRDPANLDVVFDWDDCSHHIRKIVKSRKERIEA
jgi:MoaA/NifB/PqqE/SkfB family radical SAM enzyme